MAEPEASPLRGAGASSGSGRGLTEDPGLGAAAGCLPFPSATSFQPCPPVGAAFGAAAAAPIPAAALSPPSLPARSPSSPVMALLTAAARLLGAKVSNYGRERAAPGWG